jgi:hypothetical protein
VTVQAMAMTILRIPLVIVLRTLASLHTIVIPAKAGIHSSESSEADEWIPAFAGMTVLGD